MLVALAAGQERSLSRSRVLGLVVGFVGAVLIFQLWRSGTEGDLEESLHSPDNGRRCHPSTEAAR